MNEGEVKNETLDGQMIEPGKLKIGGYIELDGCVCQITKKQDVKVGKHGSAKHIIEGIDIFRKDKKIHEKTILGGKEVFVPNVRRNEYVLLGTSDGFAQLLDSNQEIREIEISGDLEDELQQLIGDTSEMKEVIVTLISYASLIRIISHRFRSY